MKSTKCINCFNSICLSRPKTDDTKMSKKLRNPTSTSIKLDVGTSNQANAVDKKLKNITLDTNEIENDTESTENLFKIPRNKIALKPGRSLMDWIRLGTSGKDLTGVKGQFLDVTIEELEKHDKIDDAWICINGRVYNVTDYHEFHPGGYDEIAKGFGKDSTQLFMQAHSWVNYENMLQKCIVGRLTRELISPIVPKKVLNDKIDVNSITYDWHESEEDVIIVINTKNSEITKENIILDVSDVKIVLITVYCNDKVHYIHYDLQHEIGDESRVQIGINGQIEVYLRKFKSIQWTKLGEALKLNGITTNMNDKEIRYREAKLTGRKTITKNTFLLTFEFNGGTKMKIPTAKHISLKLKSNEIERSYTPIPKSMKTVEENEGKNLYLMIKTYSNGLLTPFISELKLGDFVSISDYFGEFELNKIENRDELILFAAGTGITPMIGIIYHLLTKSERKMLVKLIFFNKTESDILLRNELQLLSEMDERFGVEFVLSEPESDWSGYKGRVCMEFVKEFVENSKENVFFCICGPTPFNQTCNESSVQK